MDVFTVTSLGPTSAEVESYRAETGAYSQLPAAFPSVSERLLPGGVVDGYLVGCVTRVPEDLGYEIVDHVFAGKLEAPPPAASSVDVSLSEYRVYDYRNMASGGAVLLDGAVLIVQQDGGDVAYSALSYGTWPNPELAVADQMFVIEFDGGAKRLVHVDRDAAVVRISTQLGIGSVDVATTTALMAPPEDLTSDESREYGALVLAKAMHVAKAYGTPLRVCGNLVYGKDAGFPPYLSVEHGRSVTCPDENNVYTMARYGVDLEVAAYQATGDFTGFTPGAVTTYPPPPAPAVDFFWFVPTPPASPAGFWTQFKKCEEQI